MRAGRVSHYYSEAHFWWAGAMFSQCDASGLTTRLFDSFLTTATEALLSSEACINARDPGITPRRRDDATVHEVVCLPLASTLQTYRFQKPRRRTTKAKKQTRRSSSRQTWPCAQLFLHALGLPCSLLFRSGLNTDSRRGCAKAQSSAKHHSRAPMVA